MTTVKAEQLVSDLEAAKRALEATIAELGATEDTPAGDGWTLKEMLAHVAFWEEARIGYITSVLRQQQLPDGWRFGSGYLPERDWPHFDVHNAREAAWGREQSMAAVLDRWEQAHAALLAFLPTVTAQEIEAHHDYFVPIGAHLSAHEADLRAASSNSGTAQ